MTDVQEVIPGDPAGIRAAAQQVLTETIRTGRSAQLLDTVASSSANWQGDAANGFRQMVAGSRTRIDELASQIQHFVTTMNTYADGLDSAHQQVRRCLDIAAGFGVPWGDVQRAAFDPAALELLPPGKGPATESDLRRRAELVEEFNSVMIRARLTAHAADNAFMQAMRLSPAEIMLSYQVGDDPRQKEPFHANWIEDRIPQLNGYRVGTEQDLFTALSTEERAEFMLISNKAWEECRKRFPNQGELDGHGDAFRHAFWNAMLTRRFGPEWAAKYTTAHEMNADTKPYTQTFESMDLYNNEVGRNVAQETSGQSLDQVADAIERAVRQGRTVVVDAQGNLQYSDQVAGDQTIHPDMKGTTPSSDLP